MATSPASDEDVGGSVGAGYLLMAQNWAVAGIHSRRVLSERCSVMFCGRELGRHEWWDKTGTCLHGLNNSK